VRHCPAETPILIDLALLSLVAVCIALAIAYARVCDRLLARVIDEDPGP
jgi:hypothetical protein